MTAEKTDAVTFITEHRDIILSLYAETGSPKKNYDSLADGKLPEVKRIACATFRQYLPVFVKVSGRYLSVRDRFWLMQFAINTLTIIQSGMQKDPGGRELKTEKKSGY
jgi:hypothetical protein